MANFRAIWDIKAAPQNLTNATILELLEKEKLMLRGLVAFSDFVHAYTDEDEANESKNLISTANTDLVAGFELARFGYLKQAYTLWRSWYEQVLFALYFLEAPLHRQAWKVSEAVTISDSPKYRLMLHQLLADSSEKHAFVLVYTDRYEKLLGKMQKVKPPKDRQPLVKAGKILTVLSQGVHGTYRPTASKNETELANQITSHCLPTLNDSWIVVSELWLLLLTNVLDFPPEALILLSQGRLSKTDVERFFPKDKEDKSSASPPQNEVEILLNLNEHFLTAFN